MGMKWETDAVEPNYLEESSILVVLRAKTQYSATLKRMGALSGTRKKKKTLRLLLFDLEVSPGISIPSHPMDKIRNVPRKGADDISENPERYDCERG